MHPSAASDPECFVDLLWNADRRREIVRRPGRNQRNRRSARLQCVNGTVQRSITTDDKNAVVASALAAVVAIGDVLIEWKWAEAATAFAEVGARLASQFKTLRISCERIDE
ncbi:MAG TPA: hypothetical protein VFR10_09265 [bacterium]|nr:hypothetical protein [bacterium]